MSVFNSAIAHANRMLRRSSSKAGQSQVHKEDSESLTSKRQKEKSKGKADSSSAHSSVAESTSGSTALPASTLPANPTNPPLEPTTVLPRPTTPLQNFSEYSSRSIPDSFFCSNDFMFGAGMVLIQEQTHKIVVLWESKLKYWFFPRGRKDRGESIESTALREAWEESGYRAKFLPHYGPSRQPSAPEVREAQYLAPHCEPIFVTTRSWRARGKRRTGAQSDKQPPRDGAERIHQLQAEGEEYITTWFLGSIAADAKPTPNTQMPDERHYVAHLLTIDEAKKRVWGQEVAVLNYAWDVYVYSKRVEEMIWKKMAEGDVESTDTGTEAEGVGGPQKARKKDQSGVEASTLGIERQEDMEDGDEEIDWITESSNSSQIEVAQRRRH